MSINKRHNRIWELDFFRGIALILMIIFHLLYDLNEFYGLPIKYYQGVYYYIGKVSVIIFMFISGISCLLSRNNFGRGLKLLAIGLLITLVSHLWDPQWGIKFGILHFLGVSILLYPLVKRLNTFLLTTLVGISFYVGSLISGIQVKYDYLFPFGLKSSNFISSDYYPLFPWFGVFLLGVIFGRLFYHERKSLFGFEIQRDNSIIFIGAHTLTIYLVHQPLLILLLGLFMEPK